ncbi:MAG: C1 family peptidase [Halobacteriovoraceae bacterium]|nr:C1 family peptidase [Halobacteriovoraceae bacterium]
MYSKLLTLFTIFGLNFVLASTSALAEIDYSLAPLDPAYKDLVHPVDDSSLTKSLGRSDVEGLIKRQTSVKSQGRRGTCSIFSAVAILESRLKVRHGFEDLDLSEQFLEYLVVKGKTSDGSSSYYNFNAIANNGVPTEKVLPYGPEDWTKTPSLGDAKCGHLDSETTRYKSCLLVQRDPQVANQPDRVLLDETNPMYDPEYVTARNSAAQFRNNYIRFQNYNYNLHNVSRIKQFLDAGYDLTMGITIYYGAWNHGGGRDEGIETNTEDWYKGIVGYPERGSVDFANSPKKPAGHSIVIVGYDDQREVSVEVDMEDGTKKTFTYKGVYYFKNSWGTTSFGKDFEINGVNYPGYGMITQKYANKFGSFYHLPL